MCSIVIFFCCILTFLVLLVTNLFDSYLNKFHLIVAGMLCIKKTYFQRGAKCFVSSFRSASRARARVMVIVRPRRQQLQQRRRTARGGLGARQPQRPLKAPPLQMETTSWSSMRCSTPTPLNMRCWSSWDGGPLDRFDFLCLIDYRKACFCFRTCSKQSPFVLSGGKMLEEGHK